MECPHCRHAMVDVTDSWDTFAEARGAEYLASYVTLWRCPNCGTLAGASGITIEWVTEPEESPTPSPSQSA